MDGFKILTPCAEGVRILKLSTQITKSIKTYYKNIKNIKKILKNIKKYKNHKTFAKKYKINDFGETGGPKHPVLRPGLKTGCLGPPASPKSLILCFLVNVLRFLYILYIL